MKNLLKAAAALAVFAVPQVSNATVDWNCKPVAMLSSTYDGADCIYFTLSGVSEADPIKPGDPTFAIPRTQFGSKDALRNAPGRKACRSIGESNHKREPGLRLCSRCADHDAIEEAIDMIALHCP